MKRFLKINNYNYYYKYSLKKETTIKCIEKCKYFVIVNNYQELYKLLDYLNNKKIKYLIIGNGSKLVFTKNYKGVVISLKKLNKVTIGKNVIVEAGCLIPNLINKLKKYNLGGIEELIGIPCSIGGGLVNNISAHKVCLSDYLIKVLVYQNGEIKELNRDEISFNYHSSSLNKLVLLKAFFNFKKEELITIDNNIKKYRNYRLENQEIKYPSIGSIFKNKDQPAYQIITECQLENFKYKNIALSQKHLNFFKIKGKVEGKNVYKFVKKIEQKIYKIKKIRVESEINFIK